MSLHRIGFNSRVARAAAATALDDSDALMRVIEVSRSHCKVHDGAAIHDARRFPPWNGRRPSSSATGSLRPATRTARSGSAARVPPYTALTRIAPSGERQPLVANADFALLVMGLDGNFNLRRLERFIALVKSSGVTPVAVLTKMDLLRGRREPHGRARRAHFRRSGALRRQRHGCGLAGVPLASSRLRKHRRPAGLVGRGQIDAHQYPSG